MTHKAKDCLDVSYIIVTMVHYCYHGIYVCLQRPRKLGARFTGKDIQPDEFVQPLLEFDYDGKRDRWNGYNSDWHQEIVDEYARVEEV